MLEGMRRGLEVSHRITAWEVRNSNPALGNIFRLRLRFSAKCYGEKTLALSQNGWMDARDQLSGSDRGSTFLVNDQDFKEQPGRKPRSNFGKRNTPTLLSLLRRRETR